MGFLLFFFVFQHSFYAQTNDFKQILIAEPENPAAGSGFSEVRVRWQTSDGTRARLYLVNHQDNSLSQIGEGEKGNILFEPVLVGKIYEFRLSSIDNPNILLASVTVQGSKTVDFSPPLKQIYYSLWKRSGLITSIVLLLFLISFFLGRQPERLKLINIIFAVAAVVLIIAATLTVNKTNPRLLSDQPAPDVQETVDAARQLFEGKGYVTFFHDNQPHPPRYPPGFSIVLTPFLSFGEYPANILFGAKFFAWLCLWVAALTAWYFGGRTAAILATFFIGVSPFLEVYAGIAMSEAFTSALVVAVAILLYKPALWRVILAGVIAGFLITVRLQMIVCLPALLLALPSMRERFWAALAAVPFLLTNAVYNWTTFGSPLKNGYDYWLPHVKPFALFYATRFYPQGDGPWVIRDVLDGWFFRWICPCEIGGVQAAMPNFIFYPLVILGGFWIFAPPFVTGYGLWRAWKNKSEPHARFVLWLVALSLPLFTFYFYQGVRFMAAASTLLLLFAAVGLAKNWETFIHRHRSSPNKPPVAVSQPEFADKISPLQSAN